MRRATAALCIAAATGWLGVAVSRAEVTTFDSGTEGWSVSGRDTVVSTGGNPGANMDVTLIDVFGADIRNTTNPAFQGDYTLLGPFTLTVDVRTDSITFDGREVSRELIVELRDNTPSSAGYPYVSVWASLGVIRASHGPSDWQTFSIDVLDPTATELPPGWGGFGDEDPDTFEPILPADRTFADVLASVDELHFTTFVPGFFFGFTNFEMAVDNVGFFPAGAAPEVTFVETYEDGTNHGQWGWGTGNEQIVATDGNPGAHLQDFTLSTFTPGASTAPGDFSQFVGNFRGRGVSSVGIDLRIFDVAFHVDPSSRPLTLILHNDNGTPQNFEDDWGAWFVGDDPIPTPGGGVPALLAAGWNTYDFDVPSGDPETPEGWVFWDCTDQTIDCVITAAPSQPTGLHDWADLMADVDVAEFHYGVPGTIGILNSWDVGLDNPRITARRLAGDLDGNGEVNTSDIRLLPAEFGPCPDVCPADLNGDGVVDHVDMRLLISLVVPRIEVRIRPDRETLTWNDLSRAVFYEVHRGRLVDLSDLDGDGFPDDGYGTCIGDRVTSNQFVDAEVPAPGTGFYYLVGYETARGDRDVGYTTMGGVRADSGGCH